ncbi:hypothetical protein L7F22_022504 [Adiantum nelumboides]|nr:hypothetical protein [Adiantum nelumboides]
MYEKQSAASQIYKLKKSVELKMKEGTAMSNHLNEFHIIYSQLTTQEIVFLNFVKAMFLLITFLDSWDIFCTMLSDSVASEGLTSANVEGSLLTKEVNRKNNDKDKSNSALVVRGKQQSKEKKGKKVHNRSKSRDSKSKDDIECYHCGKKGHMKRDYTKWKQEKDKTKNSEQDEKKSSMKIKEVNVIGSGSDSDSGIATGDIFLRSNFDSIFLITEDGHAMSDWIIDLGASLHVSPHKEWFTSYVATKDYVRLGNEQVYDILGVGDV